MRLFDVWASRGSSVLRVYFGKPASAPTAARLHSLKVTGLSWALQLDIEATARKAWGHHRSKESGEKMVAKYSRDDVLPALRAQLQVLKALRRGWVPLTPQARGGMEGMLEEIRKRTFDPDDTRSGRIKNASQNRAEVIEIKEEEGEPLEVHQV